jgi:hypothetical protein
MTKVFVSEAGEKLIARDEVQEAAFKNAGLTEEPVKKTAK